MSLLDSLFYSMSAKPPMDESQRASLGLSSMYSLLDGRNDDSLRGNSGLIKQASWNMLAAGWNISGRTVAHKHDKALEVLAWLRDEARRCRHAGFLDDAETWQHVLAAGRLARPAFAAWNEYGGAFLRGREAWAGSADPRLAAAVDRCLTDERSLWRTAPWSSLPA